MNYEYAQGDTSDPAARARMLECVAPWLEQFCVDNGFVDKNGQSKFAPAMNLMIGVNPKTKKDRAFRDALLAELEYRFPGDRYPKACIRRLQTQ